MNARLVVAALTAVVVFAGGAYALGRSIKESNEPGPSATPVRIVNEEATVRAVDGGPGIPALRTPKPTRTPDPPSTDAPSTDTPSTDAPTTDTSTTDPPTTDTSTTDPPVTDKLPPRPTTDVVIDFPPETTTTTG